MQDIRERERESKEIVDQTQTPMYVLRSSTQLYVPAFTEDFHQLVHTRLPTQGTSTEDLGNTNREYTTLSNKYNLSLEARHNTNYLYTQRDRHLAKQQINLSLEGFDSKPTLITITSHLRDSNSTSTITSLQRDANTTSTITSHQRDINTITSHQRDITKYGRFTTLGGINNHKLIFLTKIRS